jgi:Fe-Mn family superoxide dismutase
MEIHHSKHHQGYVDNANKVLAKTEWENTSSLEVLLNLEKLPEPIRNTVKNNVGGHDNHSFFWEIIGPQGGGTPSSKLEKAIVKDFGSFDFFQKEFATAALSRFGSGWAWLVVRDGILEIISTANQDSPISVMKKETRIIGLDVWEHAYYLKYQNRRNDYIDAFWNIVRWDQAEKNYQKALA